MNLFGRNPVTETPNVSTEQADLQLGFWQKSRNSVYLFGGCILLLLVSRACNSHQRQAQQTQKAQHVEQQSEREQSDKDSDISALHAQLFNAQRTATAAAEAPAPTNPLTPAQMQQMAAAGVGTLPPSMFTAPAQPSGAATNSRAASGVLGSSGIDAPLSHTPAKPISLIISYRQDQPAGKAESATPRAATSLPSSVASPAPETPAAIAPAASGTPTFNAKTRNPEDQQHQLAASTGEKYRIREGTWLPCTEQLRINGFFAGNINCLISIPIYSTSGAHLLIPQGTVALGHSAAVSGQSQQRLFVVFDELIMPDGYTANYDNASGLDQIGQTGLRDQVNHHYVQMFGASIGLAALGGLSQIGNYGNSAITAGSQYRAGVTQGLSESAMRILDEFTNVLPTFTIREGARNNIHLPFNLWLPDYSKHTMKGEL